MIVSPGANSVFAAGAQFGGLFGVEGLNDVHVGLHAVTPAPRFAKPSERFGALFSIEARCLQH